MHSPKSVPGQPFGGFVRYLSMVYQLDYCKQYGCLFSGQHLQWMASWSWIDWASTTWLNQLQTTWSSSRKILFCCTGTSRNKVSFKSWCPKLGWPWLCNARLTSFFLQLSKSVRPVTWYHCGSMDSVSGPFTFSCFSYFYRVMSYLLWQNKYLDFKYRYILNIKHVIGGKEAFQLVKVLPRLSTTNIN